MGSGENLLPRRLNIFRSFRTVGQAGTGCGSTDRESDERTQHPTGEAGPARALKTCAGGTVAFRWIFLPEYINKPRFFR